MLLNQPFYDIKINFLITCLFSFKFQMDPHSGMTGLDMLGSPHSDGMSSGHSMSSSLPISSAVSVDPHSHPSAQLAVNAAAHHSAMYGAHGAHSAATASMMSPHTSLVHPHHPHHHHTPVVSMQDTDTDPRYVRYAQPRLIK